VVNEIQGRILFPKSELYVMVKNLDERLNTHVLDEQYFRITCGVYKCPFLLAFKEHKSRKGYLVASAKNASITTHSQSKHQDYERNSEVVSDNEIEMNICLD
jgi:hypothetical protein